MRLYAPEYEKVLKRSVRAAVRNDARLLKEYRRTRGQRRPMWFRWAGRLLFSCILGAVVSAVLNRTGHPQSALAIITLWTLAAASFLASLLAPPRLHGGDVRALQALPVSDFTIYEFRRDKVLGFHLMMLFDLLAGLGTLAFSMALPWPLWLGLPLIAALAWISSVAVAMFVGAKFPRIRTSWCGLGIVLFFVAWWLGKNYDGPQLMAALDFAAPAINLVAPTGWSMEFFHWLIGDACWAPFVGIVPLAYVIWKYRDSARIVGERFTYQEPTIIANSSEQIPAAMARSGEQTGRSIGVTAIVEGILSRDCFALPIWDQDWAQRLLWRWLTPRERVVADFVFAQPPAIVRPWGRILWHFLVAVIVWQVFRLLFPSTEAVMMIVTLMIPCVELLAQSCPVGAAFRRLRNFGVHISLLAPYPIGFHELTGLLLKCTIFQLPMVAMIVTGVFLVFAGSHDASLLPAMLLGLRATMVFMALRLALLIFNFGSISNDTSRSWVRTVSALLVCVIEICVFVGLAMGAFSAPEGFAWIASIILIATQYGFLRFYGWLWSRGTIDLMTLAVR